jgi:two-component system, NtrC family, sensor kinase
MLEAQEISAALGAEGPWIEIIQKMESLYADLARLQTDAERRNEELSQAKAFTDNVIRSLVNSLVVTDGQSFITMANDACLQLLGYAKEELVGRPLAEIFAEGAANPLARRSEFWERCRSRGSATGLETSLRTRSGEQIPVSLNASLIRDRTGDPGGVVLVATDLRELRRLLQEARAAAAAEREQAAERAKAYRELKSLQTRLIQSEKMSSLGRMAASVAHEINNPLGGIVVFSCLLLEQTSQDFPGRKKLETIVREASRCRDIVRGLLDFARPGEVEHRKADLNAIVQAALELLKGQTLFRDIDLRLELEPTPVEVNGSSSQLQQAFTNLLVNAAEAMNGRGRITVRSWRDTASGRAAVSFADTGCGIPPQSLAQIFEPFFTTKQEGHGTGLGLAIVYGIVERHGGTVKVDSRLAEGATFTVWLPLRGPEEAPA